MCVLLFMFLFACVSCQGIGEPEIVLNFDSPIYVCDGESREFVDTSNIFVERCNDSYAYMHGDIIFLKKVPSKAILELMVFKETSGKFEMIVSHDICDLCGELGKEDSDYRKHLQYFGLPAECPIEPGAYKIHDFGVDVTEFELKNSHCGRYEAQMKICIPTGDSCQERECVCTLKMDMIVEESLG